MTLSIKIQPLPLAADPDGVVRLGGTRVTLDSVAAAFKRGATAEEIVQQYPALELADVYSILGFYLRQQDDVERYLERRQRQAQEVRVQNEAQFDPQGVRQRLLSRRPAAGR